MKRDLSFDPRLRPARLLRGDRTAPAVCAALLVLALAAPDSCAAAFLRAHWPSTRHADVLAQGDSLARKGARASFAWFDSVIAVAHASGDLDLEMVAALREASARGFLLNAVDESTTQTLGWLPRARAAHDTLLQCLALRNLGYAELYRFHGARADSLYRKMLGLARRARLEVMEGYALIGTSFVAMQTGHLGEAERGYRRAIPRLEAGGQIIATRSARTGLANAFLQQGKSDEARDEYERVLALARASGDLRNTAACLNDLGALEYQYGDPSRAEPLYREAGIVDRAFGNEANALTALDNVGLCLEALGRTEEAVAVFESVAAGAERVRILDTVGGALGEIGNIRLNQTRYAEAESLLTRVAATQDSLRVDNWVPAVAALAQVQARTGRSNTGRRTIESALARIPPDANPDLRALLQNTLGSLLVAAGRPQDAIAPMRESCRLVGSRRGQVGASRIRYEADLAGAFETAGRADSALAHLRLAADVWERCRIDPSDSRWRESYSAVSWRVYGPLLRMLLDPARGGSARTRAAEAYTAVQRFRARTLEDALRGAAGRRVVPRVTLVHLQRETLRPGEALLDAFVTNDTTYLFVVTRGDLVAATAPGFDLIVPRLRRLRDLLESSPAADPTIESAAATLGRDLLGPVAPALSASRTVLLSAGALSEFPLGLLRLPGEREPLGASHRCATVPSATLLAASRDAGRGRSAGFTALARVTDDRGRRLDGVAREAHWLAARFPRARVRENAGDRSLDAMLAGVETNEVLHLSAHTRGSGAAPWRAGFLLGRGDGEDAYLTASRISTMRGAARVCVLAGCASAGISGSPESLPHLASAWLAAGAQSVIATLWKIEDRSTASFVRDFYESLARGATTGEALSSAQAAARASQDRAAPRDWAGFVLLGDPDTRVALELPKTTPVLRGPKR